MACYLRLLLPAALLCNASFAQIPSTKTYDPNVHAWASYSGEHGITDRWGLHVDGQWRRADFGTAWQQFQLRPGVNYRYSDHLTLTLGYAYTRAYPYGDYPVKAAFPEHRIYQQAMVRHSAGSVRISHRIRMEQRFIKYPNTVPPAWTYQNRFRYSLKSDFPLSKADDQGRRWYLPMYNEVLIGIAPNYGARPWDQNRFFVGIGRSHSKSTNVEVGYMNQFLGQRNGKVFEVNHTLFLTVSSNKMLWQLFR